MAINNRYLLDTQIFLWWMDGAKKLNNDLIKIIKNPENQIFLSVASIWEIVIKKTIGKLRMPTNWKDDLGKSGFLILSIELEHVFKIENLKYHHKDPFDRMLIAQAKVENLILITNDPKIRKYNLKTI